MHFRRFLAAFLLAALGAASTAQGDPAVIRQPYLQMATPTAITVRWRTDTEEVGRVWYGASPGTFEKFQDESSTRTEHEVRLTGLQPNTRYYYGVGNAAGVTSGNDAATYFTTSPPVGRARPTRIWAMGDFGRGNEGQLQTRNAYYAFTGSRDTDLFLPLGDNAYDTGQDWEYQERLFNVYATLLRKTHTWPAVGNHDVGFITFHNPSLPYYQNFSLPVAGECGGAPSGTEQWYSYDHGNIHFVCLDSMTADRGADGAMASWLAADLSGTNARWIIAYFHHPPYTRAGYDSDVEFFEGYQMRQNLLPILEAHGVDMVLSGHDHIYERSWLMSGHYGVSATFTPAMKKNPGLGRPEADGPYLKNVNGTVANQGTVYVVAGNAATVYPGPFPHPALPVGTSMLGTAVIDIDGAQLNFTFLTSEGVVQDHFTIVKPYGTTDTDGDGMPNDYEAEYGFNAASAADGATDADGDGMANKDEFLAGTNPRDAKSCMVTTLEKAGPGYRVRFKTQPGYVYSVQRSNSLSSNDWAEFGANIVGTGGEKVVEDSNVAGKRFYRVHVRPQ